MKIINLIFHGLMDCAARGPPAVSPACISSFARCSVTVCFGTHELTPFPPPCPLLPPYQRSVHTPEKLSFWKFYDNVQLNRLTLWLLHPTHPPIPSKVSLNVYNMKVTQKPRPLFNLYLEWKFIIYGHLWKIGVFVGYMSSNSDIYIIFVYYTIK